MEQYEKDTGRKAIWRGEVTKSFLKWKEGGKDYSNKKRISVYVPSEVVRKWQEFIEGHSMTSFSKLIRESVNFYLKEKSNFPNKVLTDLEIDFSSDNTHEIKERLTTIKGYLQLILEKHKNNLNDEIVSIINNVLGESKELANKFIVKIDKSTSKLPQYDVLLIEDDVSTISLLKNYFESKGYSFKGVLTGLKGIKELTLSTPKLILLDIILPDISGYDVCKSIKSHEKYKDVPLFYLTAVPEPKVLGKIEKTGADGYILKPFDLVDFEFLFEYL